MRRLVRSTLREYGLPVLLLAASVATTTANGARFMQNFLEGMPPVVQTKDARISRPRRLRRFSKSLSSRI